MICKDLTFYKNNPILDLFLVELKSSLHDLEVGASGSFFIYFTSIITFKL